MVSAVRLHGRGRHVLGEMSEARCAGDEQDVVVVGQEPGETYLGGRDAELGRGGDHNGMFRHLRYAGEGGAEGEVGHPCDLCCRHRSRRASPERSRRL